MLSNRFLIFFKKMFKWYHLLITNLDKMIILTNFQFTILGRWILNFNGSLIEYKKMEIWIFFIYED